MEYYAIYMVSEIVLFHLVVFISTLSKEKYHDVTSTYKI